MKNVLMSLQEQVKNAYFTFEQLCPQWSRHLYATAGEFIGDDGRYYSIVRPRMCIVGEAWGHRDDYAYIASGRKCKTCSLFGNGGRNISFIWMRHDSEFRDSFTKHMNEAHMDILAERGLK